MKSQGYSAVFLAISLITSLNSQAQEIAYLQLTDAYWQVWVMRADGGQARQVTYSRGDKTRASWYPGGHQLMVNRADGTLWTVTLENSQEQAIPTELHGMLDAVLSPDGEHICFSLSTGDSIDNNNLWLVDAAGGRPRLLTRMARLQHEPSWSAAGQDIYFLSGQGGQAHDIWRVTVNDGRAEQLTVNALYHFDIAVSADGVRAYSSNSGGHYDIWLWPKDQLPQQLTDDPALDARPSWSPDGKSLVFESTRHGEQAIWRIDVDGQDMQQLSATGVAARFPVWRQERR